MRAYLKAAKRPLTSRKTTDADGACAIDEAGPITDEWLIRAGSTAQKLLRAPAGKVKVSGLTRFEELHGRVSGRGDRTLILSHGFGTDQDAWAGIRPWLDTRFTVVSFDLAGSGPDGARSYDFERHGSVFGYADDLLDIIDELGIGDCIYVGHSMSGMIGAAAASTRPDPFHRIVMIGASPRYINDGHYVGGFDREDVGAVYDGMTANFQAWAAGYAQAVVGVPDAKAIKDFARTMGQMRPDIALATARTIFESDLRTVAAQLERPTHLIQTTHDVAVPMATANWLHRAIDRSTLDVIEAVGHLPHVTAPAEVLRVLEQRLIDRPAA